MSRAKFFRSLTVFAVLSLAACGSPEQKAQRYYENGVKLLESGDLAKARIELKNALQINEKMTDAWRALVKLETRAQNFAAALPAVRRISELDEKDFDSRLQLARFSFASGRVDEALKWINAAVDLQPRNADALALRSAILLRLRDNEGAIRDAKATLEIDKDNVDAVLILAAEMLSRNDTTGALKLLDDLPPAGRDSVGAHFLRIRIFEKTGDKQRMEATLRRLIELSPRPNQLRLALTNFLIANKRTDDAEKELRAVVASNPNDTEAKLNLVRFLGSMKGATAARAELNSFLAAGGRIFPLQSALVEIDLATGKVEDALELLTRIAAKPETPQDGLAARVRIAEVEFARKNIPATEAQIAEILKIDARNVVALRLRASLRIDRNQLDEAIADLRNALNDQPRSPELLTVLAVAFERKGSIDLADKQLSDAMRASGFAPNYGLNYVAFLRRRGQDTHADDVLVDLSNRNPQNVQVLNALAQVKLRKQDWNGANEIAQKIRAVDQKSAISDQIESTALIAQRKSDESLVLLQQNVEANPNNLQPMVALVGEYLKLKQPDKAETFVASVLKANPDNPEAHVLMGLTNLARGDQERAVQSFKTAIERAPKSGSGYMALSDFYVRQNQLDAAQNVLKSGLEQNPRNFRLRLSLASVLETQGNVDGAISEYEQLLKIDSGSLVVINNLANLLIDNHTNKASSDRAYNLALVLTKSPVPQFKDTLGWIHFRRGEFRSALPLLEEAVTALPANAVIRYHLGMTYKALGQRDKAAEQFQKALELEPKNGDLTKKIQAEGI